MSSATAAKALAAQRLLAIRDAEDSFLGFVRFMRPEWKLQPFHLDLIDHLDQLEKGCLLHPTFKRPVYNMMVNAPPRHGKQLWVETPVLTTKGWKRHGDLVPGDRVFHPSGFPTTVVAVTPPAPQRHKVTFSDGSHLLCHENHEWTVYDRSARRYRTLETRQLATSRLGPRKLHSGPANKRGGRYPYQLPRRQALKTPTTQLPIDPYLLGVWLGDGKSDGGTICWAASSAEVVNGYPLSSSWAHKTTGVHYGIIPGLTTKLRHLGLLQNKHIPHQYLLASRSQRESLLAGLIDTDGYVDKSGRVVFTTCTDALADDVETLVRSLGIRTNRELLPPRISKLATGKRPIHRIIFSPDISIPTRIPRKAISGKCLQRAIAIASVEDTGQEVMGNCIQVSSPDGLYLAGRELIPTHNSAICTVLFPLYYMARNPQRFVMSTSYNDELAVTFGREVRNLAESPNLKQPFPNFAVSSQTRAADTWGTTMGGMYYGIGLGGTTTGRGANLVILDDPIKSRADAESPTLRNKTWSFYHPGLTSRLQPSDDGKHPIQLIMMTRWHPDDVGGRIMESEDWAEGRWAHFVYRAIEEDIPTTGDPTPRPRALWPTRIPLDTLLTMKRADPREFEALYQQNPYIVGGNLIKTSYWRSYPKLEEHYRTVIIAADTAFQTKTINDYSVLVVAGLTDKGDIHIIDIMRGRWEFPDLKQRVILLNNQWRGRGLRATYIEDAASGQSLIQELRRESGLSVVPYRFGRSGDKVSRVTATLPLLEGGRVFLPESAAWLDPLLQETQEFPNSKHDDQVDAVFMAIDVLSRTGIGPDFEHIPTHESLNTGLLPGLGKSLAQLLGRHTGYRTFGS